MGHRSNNVKQTFRELSVEALRSSLQWVFGFELAERGQFTLLYFQSSVIVRRCGRYGDKDNFGGLAAVPDSVQ